jgi:hypothetical protein
MHAAPPPPGILAAAKPSAHGYQTKPAAQGYQTIAGHRFYCRRWDGNGRFAVECVLTSKRPGGQAEARPAESSMKLSALAVVLALLSCGYAWHHQPHVAEPATLTATLHANCGSIRRCIHDRIVQQLAARDEYGNVRVYCPQATGVPIVCDTVIDNSSDDPACFRYWIEWPSLRLIKSIDDTQTRLCHELVY